VISGTSLGGTSLALSDRNYPSSHALGNLPLCENLIGAAATSHIGFVIAHVEHRAGGRVCQQFDAHEQSVRSWFLPPSLDLLITDDVLEVVQQTDSVEHLLDVLAAVLRHDAVDRSAPETVEGGADAVEKRGRGGVSQLQLGPHGAGSIGLVFRETDAATVEFTPVSETPLCLVVGCHASQHRKPLPRLAGDRPDDLPVDVHVLLTSVDEGPVEVPDDRP
jgi:hypothetical protein